MTTLDYDLERLETILKENKSDLTKAKQSVKGLESRVAVLTGGTDNKEKELRSALEAARDVISELESTNAEHRANLEHLDQARAAAEAARQVLADELAQLKHQLSEGWSASAKHQAIIETAVTQLGESSRDFKRLRRKSIFRIATMLGGVSQELSAIDKHIREALDTLRRTD